MSASGASDGTAKKERVAFVIPSLDGIRAVSFLMVFLAHVGMPGIPGGFGVTVFFFLSGYLITTLLRREAERSGSVSFRLFYLRRVLRILPPFYLILSVALLLALLGVLPPEFSWQAVWAQALHYSNYWVVNHGWDGMLGGTGVYWSLAVEEHFYLLFPALYALMLRARLSGRAQHAVLMALCALVMLRRCWIVFGQGEIADYTYIASDARFDSMLFGCALAVWGNPVLDFSSGATPNEPPKASASALLAGLGGLLLLLVTFVVRDPAFRESIRYSLQGLGLYPLFFLAVRYPNLPLMRFLNWRPLRFVGTLSYSLYLLHQIVIYVIERNVPLPHVVQAALSLIISLLLAIAVWRLVEEPCAKLRSRLTTAPRAPAGVPVLRPE
jgi:peptidoglycan/LPS O-acetylase OafA/YrhL